MIGNHTLSPYMQTSGGIVFMKSSFN